MDDRAGDEMASGPIAAVDENVRLLVERLQSLGEGESAIADLVACGSRAVPHLRKFLLAGRITSVPQPRVWAVEALAWLRANDVLLEYVQAPARTHDPQLLLAEDAVKNTAARRIGETRDEQTFQILLDLSRKRNLPGLIESLAEFERPEAIPCLDRALEDDFCRAAAEAGLRRLGRRARNALMLSALMPLPNAEEETPGSLFRRRSVLMLLAEVGLDRTNWAELRPILAERDPELLVRIARITAAVADSADRFTAARKLVGVLAGLPWYLIKETETALEALAPESLLPIEAELERRASNPTRAGDEVFRLLLRLEEKLRRRP